MIKSFLKYVCVCLLLFGLWSLTLGYFPFLLFFLFCFMILFLWLVSLNAMYHTQVSLHCDEHIVNRNEHIYLTFRRLDDLYIHCGQINVEYEIIDIFHQCVSVKKVTLLDEMAMDMITLPHCGYYTIRLKVLHCYDILRCFSHQSISHESFSLYVFPNYKQVSLSLLETFQEHYDAVEYAPHHGGDDYSEIYELRNYNEDDSLRHIHWKASLKKNELLVKVGSQPIIKRITIAVLYQENDDYNDQQFDLFYSLCQDLLKRHVPFEVLIPQYLDLPVHNEYIAHIDQLKDVLKKIMKTPVDHFDFVEKHQNIYMIQGKKIEVYQS